MGEAKDKFGIVIKSVDTRLNKINPKRDHEK